MNRTTENDYIDLLYNTIVYLNRYGVVVLCILGNLGNLFTALIFSKKSWKKNVCVFYFNVCLFINTCYINFFMLVMSLTTGWHINLLNAHIIVCKVFYYLVFLFSILLPTVLVLASIDRLLISSQKVDTRLYSSKRLAYCSISVGIIFWSLFFIHALIKMEIIEIYPSVFICFYDWSGFYPQFIVYTSVIVNILFFLVMITLTGLAFENVRHIRVLPRQRNAIRVMTKKDFQLLRCLFVQDIVYILFSITLNVNTIYGAVKTNQIGTPLTYAVDYLFQQLAIFLHHVPYCVSFAIFIMVSKAFRQELKRMIYHLCGKELIVPREEGHTGRNRKYENSLVTIHVTPPS